MADIIYSPLFLKNIHDIYKQRGQDWLRGLTDVINQLSSEWNFSYVRSLPDLSYNFVCIVRFKDEQDTAVLKVSPDLTRSSAEADWLGSMRHSAPEVYHCDHKCGAILMEHIRPGTSLKKHVLAGKDDEATRIVCQMILSLQDQALPSVEFKHLAELKSDLNVLDKAYDARLLSKAKSLFHDLTIDKSSDKLLHGDLHHDNILSSGTDWKVIDPHGYIGDPASEAGAMIRNMWDYYKVPGDINRVVERRLKIMIDELPFDHQRIKAWAFCITVLSAAWTVMDHADANMTDLDLEVASAIEKVKLT